MPNNTRRVLAASTIALSVTLISHWEGEDLVAKHNSFDPAGVITVCDGVTNMDWPWLKSGMKFTHKQCQDAFAELIPKYWAPIAACIPSAADMPPHRQAALLSFSYNLGPGRICGVKKNGKLTGNEIAANFNAGQVEQACKRMLLYVRAAGKTLQGLVNRRTDKVWGEEPWCLRKD
jgi:lysozyme